VATYPIVVQVSVTGPRQVKTRDRRSEVRGSPARLVRNRIEPGPWLGVGSIFVASSLEEAGAHWVSTGSRYRGLACSVRMRSRVAKVGR
jgi:hypothetical protein